MQRHHRALAEADQRQSTLVQAAFGELLIDEGVERWPRRDYPAPTLFRIAHGERKPLSASWRHRTPLGGVWRYEICVRQEAAPLPTDFDQIIAVGAIAVQKNH